MGRSQKMLEWAEKRPDLFKIEAEGTGSVTKGLFEYHGIQYWLWDKENLRFNSDVISIIEIEMLRSACYVPTDEIVSQFAEQAGVESDEAEVLWYQSNRQQYELWSNCVVYGWTHPNVNTIMSPDNGAEYHWAPDVRRLISESAYRAMASWAKAKQCYVPTDQELLDWALQHGWEQQADSMYSPSLDHYTVSDWTLLSDRLRNDMLDGWKKPEPEPVKPKRGRPKKSMSTERKENLKASMSTEKKENLKVKMKQKWGEAEMIGRYYGVSKHEGLTRRDVLELSGELEEVLAKAAAGQKDPNARVNCPTCGGDMIRRNSDFGPFWGCANFPDCRGKRKIDEKPLEVTQEKKDEAKRKLDLTIKYLEDMGGDVREWIAMAERMLRK